MISKVRCKICGQERQSAIVGANGVCDLCRGPYRVYSREEILNAKIDDPNYSLASKFTPGRAERLIGPTREGVSAPSPDSDKNHNEE